MSLGCTLQTGVSALKSYSKGLEVIGNNVSNANTTGFKKGRAEYADEPAEKATKTDATPPATKKK